MPREQIILECTEAAAEGKSPSRYFATKNPKSQKPNAKTRIRRKKYNKALRRHTWHEEKKK